ncbi:MAG: RidA family protein [Hyphomonadaceae bacterium]|nr:RidA family protein [Burkholderiaceae bacterium]MBP9235522.1 RidA family protein [Hyphomonadaceae bacterium]
MSDIAYQTVLPEGWPRPRGFSHAVTARGATQVRIAGQIGVIRGEPSVAADADMGTQWGRAMANLVTVLRAAGGRPEHLIMLRAYVTDIGEFNRAGAAVGKAWGETLGKHFPAMTLVQVSGLIDPAAKVEIEGEALLP